MCVCIYACMYLLLHGHQVRIKRGERSNQMEGILQNDHYKLYLDYENVCNRCQPNIIRLTIILRIIIL